MDALDFGGARGWLRKALLFQVRKYAAMVIEADGQSLALVMFEQKRQALVEVAIHFRPLARRHMRALVEQAQLTLQVLGQDGILACARIRETDARAQRMARLAGFRPGRLADRTIWIGRTAREHIHQQSDRGRGEGRREGPEAGGGAAAG